ncbi:TonB-dependent receptor [Spongiibacter taiwanensis]
MTSRKFRGVPLPLVSAIAAAGTMLVSNSAVAQLEEVVVTAQKRSESAQEVPIAITAVTELALEKSGITGSDELSMVVPNLQFSRQLASATPFIRGVGTKNSSAGEESSVSTYVDGVYYSSMVASIMEFNNIERIEVLRGPQGTLFGRNATGGLIHVITKDPQFETEGKIKAGYGSYNTYKFGGYATTGLSEKVAGDISVLYTKREDGYGDNRFTGNPRERPGEEDRSIRSKLLFDMSEQTSILASALYATRESDVGIARQPAKGSNANFGAAYTGDFQDINSDWTPLAEADQRSYSLKVTHAFEGAELIATTGYNDINSFLLLDQDSGPAHVVNFLVRERSEQFSQEFQLSSTGAGPFQWTAGVYYMAALSQNDPTQTTSANPAFNVTMDTEQETESQAIYGQVSYDFSDATKVTLGLRWTLDEREFSGRTTNTISGAPVNPAEPYLEEEESWEEPTWRLGVDHQLNDEVLVYAYHARGFKSGVFNTLTNNGAIPDPVDPEILDAYEIGLKGDFLNNSLRVNTAIFFYEFENLQLQQINAGSIFLFNVGDSEMQGAEVETTYFVTENLDLNLSVAYLDTEYVEFPDGPIISPNPAGPGNVTTSGDLAGNEMTRAPEFTYSLSANYRQQTGMGELSYNIAYYYNDGFFWEPDNRTEQDSYDVLNAEIAFTTKDENWRFRIFGRNLLDSEYSYYSQQSSFGDFVSAAPPRTYGVEVEYRF